MRNSLLLISVLIATNIFASNAEVNGHVNLKNSQYESLEVNGSLTFENLEVRDELEVNGSKEGKNLKCSKIESTGAFEVDGLIVQNIENYGSFIGKNVEISGSGVFNGKVEIQNGKLNEIEISSSKAIFKDSIINKILVKKIEIDSNWSFLWNKNKKDKNIIELHGNSSVGDIYCEEVGEIHIFDKSQVIGKTVNCEIIKQ